MPPPVSTLPFSPKAAYLCLIHLELNALLLFVFVGQHQKWLLLRDQSVQWSMSDALVLCFPLSHVVPLGACVASQSEGIVHPQMVCGEGSLEPGVVATEGSLEPGVVAIEVQSHLSKA